MLLLKKATGVINGSCVRPRMQTFGGALKILVPQLSVYAAGSLRSFCTIQTKTLAHRKGRSGSLGRKGTDREKQKGGRKKSGLPWFSEPEARCSRTNGPEVIFVTELLKWNPVGSLVASAGCQRERWLGWLSVRASAISSETRSALSRNDSHGRNGNEHCHRVPCKDGCRAARANLNAQL